MKKAMIEGGGSSRLAFAVGQLGYNKDVDIEYATVIAPPPALRIQIDGMKIELDEEDVIIPQSLTRWTEKIAIKPSTASLTWSNYTRTVDGSSTTKNSEVTAGTLSTTEFEIEHHNELKAGDRIALITSEESLRYFVLDRIVIGGSA